MNAGLRYSSLESIDSSISSVIADIDELFECSKYLRDHENDSTRKAWLRRASKKLEKARETLLSVDEF